MLCPRPVAPRVGLIRAVIRRTLFVAKWLLLRGRDGSAGLAFVLEVIGQGMWRFCSSARWLAARLVPVGSSLGFLCVVTTESISQAYEVEGWLASVSAGSKRTNSTTFVAATVDDSWRLITRYDANNYRVRTNPDGRAGPPVDVSKENWHGLSFDGTNFFDILYDHPVVPVDGRAGTITFGSQPVHATWHNSVPWFALLSRSYLDGGEPVAPPWLIASDSGVANALDVQVLRSLEEPRLPVQAVFTFSSEMAANLKRSPFLSHEPRALEMHKAFPQELSVYTNDQVVARYSVESHAGHGDLSLPTKFRLEIYTHSRTAPGIVGTSVISGGLTAVRPVENRTFVPDVSEKLYVTDRRVSSAGDKIDFVYYESEDGRWLTLDSDELRALYRAKVGLIKRQHLFGTDSLKRIIAVVALCVLLAPIALFLRRKARTARPIHSI